LAERIKNGTYDPTFFAELTQIKINQLITYLAELTAVVKSHEVLKTAKEQLDQHREMIERVPLEDTPTLKETLLGEIQSIERNEGEVGSYNVGYNTALSDVETIINRLMV